MLTWINRNSNSAYPGQFHGSYDDAMAPGRIDLQYPRLLICRVWVLSVGWRILVAFSPYVKHRTCWPVKLDLN